jgi:hypothetical protein
MRILTSVGQQRGETLLAVRGELVYPSGAAGPGLAPAGAQILRPLVVLDDEAAMLQPTQCGVQRAEGAGAKRPEQIGKSFAQFVAVHRIVMEHPEHRQLQHTAPPSRHFDV